MSSAYETLLDKVHQIYDLEKAARVLSWDREVSMPRGGDTARIQQLTTLRRLSHTLLTSDQMGELVEAAAVELNGVPYESKPASLVRFLRRDYHNARKLPPDFFAHLTATIGQAGTAWKQARAADDFAVFRPWLEKVVALQREMVELLGYPDKPYDALLDKWEPGARTADVQATFAATKQALLPLYQAIRQRGRPVDDSCLRQPYDVEKQKAFAHYLAAAVGYDFERGHLGASVHPFSTGFARDDVRITTRYYPDFLGMSVFATLHEAGHAIYEQNTDPELTRTPLARETSAGFDESQSRLAENIIGRSRGFWQVHFPKLQASFPQQLGDCTVDAFYRAINQVKPGLIRVEADELTYNFHIILRFELEQGLIHGDLAVADLPAAWNDQMQATLGLTPPDDREGVLQDVHWSWGYFGYFPTYALGNLYAAQLYEAAVTQDPTIGEELENGRPEALLAWVAENVHRPGRKFPPTELIWRATGRPLGHQAFVRYATRKFGEIYDL